MRPFLYESSSSVQEAAARSGTGSAFIAGGTTLLDLMKLEVMNPSRLVDVNQLPQMRGIEMREDGLHIGALEKMSDVATHPEVVANYPVISEALFKTISTSCLEQLQSAKTNYARENSSPRYVFRGYRGPGNPAI